MKKKTLVLIGIAVCAILLTSPVLASAGYSKIYGNANEDDVLDMRDVTYIKLVIFGKKPATTFADANYDGKISMLDVGQTKLIILGKEAKLTFVDQASHKSLGSKDPTDRVVTIPRPVERVVSLNPEATRIMIALGDADKLVGVDSAFPKYLLNTYPKVFQEGEKVPIVGSLDNPNLEAILSVKPDVILGGYGRSRAANDLIQEKTEITVVWVHAAGHYSPAIEESFDEIEITGLILGKEKKAEEIVSYFKEKIDKVTEVTSDIPASEKQKVYLAFWCSKDVGITRTVQSYSPLNLAGGINIAQDAEGPMYAWGMSWEHAADVSIEQIIAWNPDIILIMGGSKKAGITAEDVLSDPRLQTINAVKNNKVYYTLGMNYGWDPPRPFFEILLVAKQLYPDRFKDLDLEKEGNEILERFYGVDGLWTELNEERGYI